MKKSNIKKVNKHALDFEKTLPYFVDHIECGNFLSEKVLEKINFEEGVFFTLLPKEANIKRLYHFPYGGILPSLGKDENAKYANFWPTPTIDDALSLFIFNFLRNNKSKFAVFEDVVARITHKHIVIEGVDLRLFAEEVYYITNSKTKLDLITEAIQKTGEVWHFLSGLTHGLDHVKTSFEEEDFYLICRNLSYVIAGAYDGEGYIFWENSLISRDSTINIGLHIII